MRANPAHYVLALVLLLQVACDDDQVTAPDTVLPDGTEVAVRDDGAFTLRRGGRTLFATAPGQGPTLATHDEEALGDLGIWTFRRSNESRTALRFAGVRREGEAVVLDWRLPDGADGATLRITAGEGRTHLTLQIAGAPDSVLLPVRCDAEGSFHGFGEQYNATEQTGEAFDLIVSEQGQGRDGSNRGLTGDAHTTYFPMPWYVDGRGFGVLFGTDHRVRVDLCAADPQVAWFEFTSGGPVSWQVLHGPSVLEVLDQLGDTVGRPTAPPDWAYDLWVGAQGGQQAILDEAEALATADIPVGVLWVQDWTGTRPNFSGGFGVQYRWEADPVLYPDLRGLTDALHARGLRFLGYANPFVDPALPDHFAEMEAAGLLITREDGETYLHVAPNGVSSHPDLTREAARDYVRAHLVDLVEVHGMDGWMADFGEWVPLDVAWSDGSDGRATHNLYPLLWHQVNREALEQSRSDDYVVFARSGWTGVQRHSQIHWVGDQEASFSPTDGLPTVVPALLNLGLSGVPFVTHDIAGFSGGASTKELFLRWTELGAFTPIMRTHEGDRRDVNWSWEKDAETTAHFRRFARVHAALKEDFLALAEQAAAHSTPILRHLMMVFPEDRATWTVHDQFMVGDALLVAPVVEEGATARRLYLPAGEWFHVWTGEAASGPAWIEVEAPPGAPPVYARGEDRPDLRAVWAE